jgi:hypothetical protein
VESYTSRSKLPPPHPPKSFFETLLQIGSRWLELAQWDCIGLDLAQKGFKSVTLPAVLPSVSWTMLRPLPTKNDGLYRLQQCDRVHVKGHRHGPPSGSSVDLGL